MLANNGNMCLANAMSKLLVYCPPLQELFKEQGRLVGQHEEGDTGGIVTSLMDAMREKRQFINMTVRFRDRVVAFSH
jgi:hypothetical protein